MCKASVDGTPKVSKSGQYPEDQSISKQITKL